MKNMYNYNKKNITMNRITKKMLMLFVLLLGMQELSHAAVEPPMTSKFGRGLGGVVAVGGLGVMGYEGWNLYQATNKVINQRTEKGIETDMSDFETLKTVLTLALKNRRVSKPKAALGLALCLGGLVGSGLSHRSITKVHEQNITTESNRVNAHKVLVEDANLFENVERNAFKNSSPKNEADLKKLKEIQDKLDAPKKVKIILADIDFLKTDSPKTYAKYLAEIAAHNEAANVAGRNAEAKKWNKFFNDYTAAAIFDRIYLTADICGNGALTHDLASLNRWKAANEPLLTYLIANGFEKMAASEKGTAGELILIVPNAGLAATHKAIYDIFIVEVKKNNFEYLNAEVKKKQVAMAQEAKKANGNPQFLEFDLLLKSISKEAHEKRNDYFVTEPANGLPAEDYAVSNIEETYKNFLKNQLVARAQKLELVTKAHGKGLTLLSKAYFGKPLNYDLKNENDVNKILDDLKWMFAAKQSLDSRAAAGPAQKRQKYDLLKHLNDEIKHINDNKKKIVLEQIAAWHSKDAKSTAADILKPSAAFFTEIYTVVNEIGYAALRNPQDTDDEVKAMKELENATKCFHSDYKIIIDKALAALKSDDNGHTKAYSLFLNQGKLDKIKFFPPGALNINGTFDAAIMALKVNLSYSVWGWVWEDTNDKLTLMTSSDFWMHFAGW